MNINAFSAQRRERRRAVFAKRGRGRAFHRHVDVDVLFGARGRRHGSSYHGDVDVRVIGIDPGLSGALAVVNSVDGTFTVEAVYDLPTYSETTSTGKNRRYIDPVALSKLIASLGPVDKFTVERLSAPPGISGMAAYSLGATSATLATVLRMAGVSYRLTSPVVWKRALGVPADKEAARQFACKLFGQDKHWPLKKSHNRAEAALLAVWTIVAA